MRAQLVLPTSGKNMSLTERGVGQLFQDLQSQRERGENKYTDGAHRLWMRWGCHEKVFVTWEPSLKY